MPKSAKPTVRYDKYTTITQKCRKITPGKDYREKCGLVAPSADGQVAHGLCPYDISDCFFDAGISRY
jgi:hypothetical protein